MMATVTVPTHPRGESATSTKEVDKKLEDGGKAWLDAHYDPIASLYTFSSCMALADLNLDGDHKLLVGNLGTGQMDMKLRVYKGTELNFETPLLDLPTALCTFYMDNTEPRTPAVAVSSGACIYIYKNLRPYFKFTVPHLQINSTEAELWEQAKEDKINALTMYQQFGNMNNEVMDRPFTVRTHKFLQLETEDLESFVDIFKHVPLKRQTVITCMSTINKSHADENAVSCLVVGTENKEIYILDPEAFTILTKLSVPAVPVFLSPNGQYDVEYQVAVVCRDACLYTIKGGSHTPKYRLPFSSQCCGMVRVDQHHVVIGCMDQTISCFSLKGKRHWSQKMPDVITVLETLDYRTQGVKGVIVALRNKEIRIYREKYLVNYFKVNDVVVGLKFGQFGREDGSLLMVTQGGSLIIKILKRNTSLEAKDSKGASHRAQAAKFNLPKKTKVTVDQTVRERESFIDMHNIFQRDMFRLKLTTARAYTKVLSSSLAPVITSDSGGTSLNISAEVQGLGPMFRLTVNVQNSSPTDLPTDLYITFKCDETLYRMEKKLIKLPMLVPQLKYKFETMVESLDDLGRAENIRVFVLQKDNAVPLLTAAIRMPLSENVITV